MSKALAVALGLWIAGAAAAGPATPMRSVKVTLQQSRGDDWVTVDPRTVLQAGGTVRFRFQASFSGFLYVLNQTSHGDYLWLFPTPQSGTENEIEAGREYTIPATAGAFLIPPAPGFDTVYWMIVPARLPELPAFPAPPRSARPNPLRPRCQSGPLRARGMCLDESAGARPLTPAEGLPQALAPESHSARQFKVERSDMFHEIWGGANGPFLYEFRIAHR
jgi:uncharacterized protein DUF4384